MKEARARIKINRLLEEAGWRFFDQDGHKANILLENHVRLTPRHLSGFGDDFETSPHGFVDFLLLDSKGYPFIVLEAKAEDKHPLVGKEQARRYALSQGARYVLLSNGNQHYLWDVQRGNPQVIGRFPSPQSVEAYAAFQPNPAALVKENVERDYIALTQYPAYKTDPAYLDPSTRDPFIADAKLRFLRHYQVKAILALQAAVKNGQDRFLFEMATGTGKTLVSAAVIKLMLRTGNARRVLFLVDRLELEVQAANSIDAYLKSDYHTVIYKQDRDDWRKAEIVVSTVQTFLFNNAYKRLFAPDDFDFVISDEAHRSIGGNARAVFEYFIGYKLGLTATPKEYLKNIDPHHAAGDPRELERRALLDTYATFGCANGIPTFRYSLLDGVKDGYLINPLVVDARTDITTEMLSRQGYSVMVTDEEGQDVKQTFLRRNFEKTFFSDNTNQVFCQVLLDHGLCDPITGEFGKTIVFCVSQDHAARITNILNVEAALRYPGRYQSDFALQVTSSVPGAQQMSIAFNSDNNKLSGSGNVDPRYNTSKTRVCVTVGMMTTGYDCTDLLNLALMRPIFSPTDFIQVKGRGTRPHDHSLQIIDRDYRRRIGAQFKERFKLFDYFANCQYFETEFKYDQVLSLPRVSHPPSEPGPGDVISDPPPPGSFQYESTRADTIKTCSETPVDPSGMKIDRMYFETFGQRLLADSALAEKVRAGAWDEADAYIQQHHLDRPKEYYTREKLQQALSLDRRITIREILEYVFGYNPLIKTADELLDEAFDRFDTRCLPPDQYFADACSVFKTYIQDPDFRHIIDTGAFAQLNFHVCGPAFLRLPPTLRRQIPDYIKDYVNLNQFQP